MSVPKSSEAVTRGVRVTATPFFLPQESSPEERQFVFGYRIRLLNEGDRTVQLLSRHWIIIDADGEQEEVRGAGVVGKTPVLEPGQSFEYQSFCPLRTYWGTMEGTYRMRFEDGEQFDIAVGRFHLAAPEAKLADRR
jgi:ApaG protein